MKLARNQWKWVLGLAVGGVAIATAAVPLLMPLAPSPPDTASEGGARQQWQQRQQQTAETIASFDRATLIGNSPTKGSADAPVLLIKFSDFQCPYCAEAQMVMEEFTAAHPEEVLYVYKHLPLMQIHPEALPAAKAAWAAGQQGQFWPYHNALFQAQAQLGAALYEQIARDLGLDLEQFNRDFNSDEARAAVARDLALAETLAVNSTPTFLMNELLIPGGAPLEFFQQALERLQAAEG